MKANFTCRLKAETASAKSERCAGADCENSGIAFVNYRKMKLTTKALLIKIGEAKKEARACLRIDRFEVTKSGSVSKKEKAENEKPITKKPKTKVNFSFRVNRTKFRETYRREGQYLLRGHLARASPSHALGILHPAHGSRGSLQKSEGRF